MKQDGIISFLCSFPCNAGGSSRLPVRSASMPVCGALSGLADVGKAMECLPQAARACSLPLPLWSATMDRQHRPHLRLPEWLATVFCLPALRHLRHLRQVPQTCPHHPVSDCVHGAVLFTHRLVLHLPHQLELARVPHVHPLHQQVL